MIPKSLRWRLPISYALVALLATVALGAALLTLLQQFYRQQELNYLTGNAQTIGERIVPYVEEMDIGQLQATIKGLAFLSQTRVVVFSPDHSLLLADSGDPRLSDENTQIAVSVEVDGVEQTFGQTGATNNLSQVTESTIVIEPGLFGSVDENVVTEIIENTPTDGENLLLESEIQDASGVITRTTIVTRQVQSEALPVVGTQFGFGFGGGDVSETAVSNLTVRLPILGENGRLLGTVELSQGPAYGRDILQNVFWGWLIASLVAVLLAGLAGWLASRRLVRPLLTLTQVTTQMADGDLAARTAVQRQDELGTLGRSFNKMADQVEGTITTLRQFIADAAHELHTPLTALQTDLQTLRQTELEPVQAAKIERAQEQAIRLQTLTNSLLDLSRIEAKTNGDSEVVNLNQLLQETAELFASRAEQKEIQFDLTLPEESLQVQGSPLRLRQAVQNLLDNALKFTPAGGAVTVALGQDENFARLTITDTGIGIPEEDVPHLFGRFHRGRNTADFPGNGLGLAIVQAIVAGCNGRIAIQSTPPGTRVTIQLPLNTNQ
ncbi:MAG: HAMP domain-containing histidine kinase [Ardenticatenaceae bacterium]|nr:HAMP domain-containing histidine kinase [Ardenticatenaceae bacterium]